jgi:hypothetical protein
MICFYEEPQMEFDISMTFGEQRTELNFQKLKEVLIERLKLALVERFVMPNRKYFRIPAIAKKDPKPDIISRVEVKSNLKNREQSTTLQRELEFRELRSTTTTTNNNNNNDNNTNNNITTTNNANTNTTNKKVKNRNDMKKSYFSSSLLLIFPHENNSPFMLLMLMRTKRWPKL